MADETHEEKAVVHTKMTWLGVAVALIISLASLTGLWFWQHKRPPVSGVCGASDLSLSIGRDEPANNTTYVHAVLTNTGSRTCTLRGFPIVSVLNAAGINPVTGDARHNDTFEAHTVTLGPQETAYAVIGFPARSLFEENQCLTDPTTLRLYLPTDVITPGTQPLSTPLARVACPGMSVTVLLSGL